MVLGKCPLSLKEKETINRIYDMCFSIGMKQKTKNNLRANSYSKSILKTDQKHLPLEELFFQKTNTHTHTKKQNPKTNKQAFLLDW